MSRRLLTLLLVLGLASAVPSAAAPIPSEATPAAVAPADSLASLLSPQLAAHFNVEGEWTLDPVRPWAPPAGAALEVIEFPSALASTLFLRVRLHTATTAAPTEFTLVLRARLWRDAFVATEPFARGDTPDAGRLEVRRVDVLREREAVPAATDLSTLVLNRALAAGRLLSWRDVGRRPLVRRGDVIEVSAIDGPLAITMKAQAMQDGAAGDLVRVRNLESRREFPVLVVAEARAEVRF